MNETQRTVPYGFCWCGCGQRTSLARQTDTRLGYIKGQPVFYVRGHGSRKPIRYLVEDHGYETPCWIWQLWCTSEGYGRMSDGKGVSRLAHRVMWEREHGPVPAGLPLDHLCRQPSCVNPDHLEPVTNAENARRSRTAKLTEQQVWAIRRELANGMTQKSLAAAYGVSAATIASIATGRSWVFVPGS